MKFTLLIIPILIIIIIFVLITTNIKYRIEIYQFPYAKTLFFAQYKFLGIWLYIGTYRGHLTHFSNKTYCESLEEAENRIKQHKINIKRSENWIYKIETIINL